MQTLRSLQQMQEQQGHLLQQQQTLLGQQLFPPAPPAPTGPPEGAPAAAGPEGAPAPVAEQWLRLCNQCGQQSYFREGCCLNEGCVTGLSFVMVCLFVYLRGE